MEAEEKTPKINKTTKPKAVRTKVKKISAAEAPKEVKKDKFYGTGRRKTAIAKVWLTSGSGLRLVNKKPAGEYFCGREVLLKCIEVPFAAVSSPPMDLFAEVFGGGVPAQADAVRMGIARALIDFNNEYRLTLRRLDLLRRDPREKERKKAGLKRARKAFQYSKR